MDLICKEPYFPVGGTYREPCKFSFGAGGGAKTLNAVRCGGLGDLARYADDAVALVTLEVVLCEDVAEPAIRTSELRDWTFAPTTVR